LGGKYCLFMFHGEKGGAIGPSQREFTSVGVFLSRGGWRGAEKKGGTDFFGRAIYVTDGILSRREQKYPEKNER